MISILIVFSCYLFDSRQTGASFWPHDFSSTWRLLLPGNIFSFIGVDIVSSSPPL